MASRSLGSLTIDLIAKIGAFVQGMDKAAREADKKFNQIRKGAKGVGIAFGAIGGAVASGVAVVIRNTMQAEKSLAQLDAILKSTGNAAGYTKQQMVEMARGFQQASTFGTNEIIDAQTRLLSYSGILGENIPRAMQSVIDQATRLGMSVSQSAETIGRALESPSKAAAALAQQGFGAAFTKEVRASIDALVAAGREGEAQIKILEILEESYGGAAEAARNTFGGALEALKNTLGDLLSGDGDSLNGLTDAINDLIKTLNDPDVRKGFQLIVRGATEGATAVAGLTNEFAQAISKYREWLADAGRLPADMLDSIDQIDVRIRKLAQMQYGGGLLNNLRRAIFGDAIGQQLREAVAERNAFPWRNVISGANTVVPGARSGGGGGGGGKTGKSEAEKEAERLQRAYETLMGSMKERIALFNTEGEAAKVAYDLEHGSLKALDSARKQELLGLAEQYDAMVKLREENKARMDAAAEETERINRGLEAGKEVLDDLRFELELMKMTNAERATAIQLRGLEAEAVERYGEEIAALNRQIEEAMKVEAYWHDLQRDMSDAFYDFAVGAKSAKDALGDFLDAIYSNSIKAAADYFSEAIANMFKGAASGNSQGGGWGDFMSWLGGFFGGGRANGGWAEPNTMYRVNERGLEMATVNGRDYLLTGKSGAHITPAGQWGGGGVSIQQTNYFDRNNSRATPEQIAVRTGQAIQRQTARTGR